MSDSSSKRTTTAASWYPGHMAAGLRAVLESAALIDVVVEVRDARVPRSTAVAQMHARLKTKPTFILLNRQDLADPKVTRRWLEALSKAGSRAFSGVGTRASSLRALRDALLRQHAKRARLRIAVVGAPNTGKSSVINALLRRKGAPVQDKPGVTQHIRWLPLDSKAELLDTPGVLQPRISDANSVWRLALCGILPESTFDLESVVSQFTAWLAAHKRTNAQAADLETFARRRGMLRRGGEPDRLNAARVLVKEFRAGKIGRMTFEDPRATQ